MVRKQLYLEEAQDRALKRRARELGVSEAEIVRRALDAALFGPEPARRRAIESFLSRAAVIAETHAFPDSYCFDRQKLYEEDRRFTRWRRDE